MNRWKRFTAVLLSAAMVVTGTQIPAYAQPYEEIIIGQDDGVLAEEITESVWQEETAEAAQAEETQETVEEAELTGAVSSGENRKIDYSSTMPYYEVHNMKELQEVIKASALDGEETMIRLGDTYGMKNDIRKYYVSENLIIPKGKNIVLYPYSRNIYYNKNGVSCNEADPFRIIIEEGAALKIVGTDSIVIDMGIENHGRFVVQNSDPKNYESDAPEFRPMHGCALKNCEGAEATLEGGLYRSSGDLSTYTIYNEGKLTINDAVVHGSSSSNIGAIYNEGTLICESPTIESYKSSPSINGIDNIGKDAALMIRGANRIRNCDANDYGIRNVGGKVEIGKEAEYSNIYGILSVSGGSVLMKGGWVTKVITASGMATEEYAGLEDGTFTMIGGSVKQVFYDKNLPELKFGRVDSWGLPSKLADACVVKISENGLEPCQDLTSYQYLALSEEEHKLEERKVFKEDPDGKFEYNGKKYAAPYSIEDGKAQYPSTWQQPETISTNEAFLKVTKEGGSYEITEPLYISENVVVEKDLELSGKGIYFNEATSLNGELKAGSLTVAPGATLHSHITFYQQAIDGGSVSSNQPTVMNYGRLEYSHIIQELTPLANSEYKAVAFENYGTCESIKVEQNTQGVSENCPIGIVNHKDADIRDCYLYTRDMHAVSVKNAGYIEEVNLAAVSPSNEQPLAINEETGVIDEFYLYRDAVLYDGIMVDNAGTLTIHYSQGPQVIAGTAVRNTGTLVVYGSISAGENGTAVENSGTLLMKDGSIYNRAKGKCNSYAITYTEGHEPVLMSGVVYGTRYDKDKKKWIPQVSTNAAEGSAVVKKTGEKAEKGFFRHAEDEYLIDSENAAEIENGKIVYDSSVRKKDKIYYLMEKGESVSASAIFSYRTVGLSGNSFTFASKDPNVVLHESISGIDVFTAVGTGITTVMASSNETKASDYVSIEVVEEGMREKIIADSYELRLMSDNLEINANQKEFNIYFEFQLKEHAVGAEKYLNLADSFYPTFAISGKSVDTKADFHKYFWHTSTRPCEEEHCFALHFLTQTDNSGKTPVTWLARDGVTAFDDLKFTLQLENKVAGKRTSVPLGPAFHLQIDQTKPKVQFQPVELNSAYTNGASMKINDETYYPNLITNDMLKKNGKGNDADNLSTVRISHYPNGFDGDGSNLYYEGNATKKKGKIPLKVTFRDYVGSFDAVLPVSVKSEYPKLNVNQKAITLPMKPSQTSDIQICSDLLEGEFVDQKSPLGLGSVDWVEIVGNSSFGLEKRNIAVSKVYYDINKKYYSIDSNLYLRPRKELKKAETVTFKVHYKGVKRKAGKEYTTTFKVKVKPVPENKFAMKVMGKPVLYISENKAKNGAIEGNEAIGFTFNPSHYSNGYVKVLSHDENISVYANDYNDFKYVEIRANEKTKITDKKAAFTVGWFAADGTPLIKKPVKVTVKFETGDPSVVISDVTIDLNKPRTETKQPYSALKETTNVSMGVPVKIVRKNATYGSYGSEYFIYNSDTGKIYPKLSALQEGLIIPGGTYDMRFYFRDRLGNRLPTRHIKIHVKEVKQAKAALAQKEVRFSKNFTRARNMITVKTLQPYYGMKIKSAELSGKDAGLFELMNDTADTNPYSNEENTNYFISFKDTKKPKKLKTGNKKVELIVTYENGATAKVKLPVVIY